MQCMELLGKGYEMHSVDIATAFFADKSKRCGFMGEEAKQYIHGTNQKLYLGQILPECIEKIGSGIDCLILDTAHVLPGELLDFLVAFPYLKENAVVILHDVVNNWCVEGKTKFRERANATKVLFDSVSAEKYLMRDDTEIGRKRKGFPNIGAFQVTSATRENLTNVVSSLSNTWHYMPDDRQLRLYMPKIKESLDEEGRWILRGALKVNQDIARAPEDIKQSSLAWASVVKKALFRKKRRI